MDRNWSAAVALKKMPEKTVDATSPTRVRVSGSTRLTIFVSIPLAFITPPKQIAHRIIHTVLSIPAMPHLHAVIDEHRHYTADHPRAREHADEQQDDNWRTDTPYRMIDFLFQHLPRGVEEEHGDEDRDACREDEDKLTRARERINAIDAYRYGKK